MTFTDPQPCFICKRRDDGIGILKHKTTRWLCQDCVTIAKKANAMSQREFDTCEHEAIDEALNAGGQLLDDFGKTDLAELDPSQFHLLGVKIIRTFGEAMRTRIQNHEAPF